MPEPDLGFQRSNGGLTTVLPVRGPSRNGEASSANAVCAAGASSSPGPEATLAPSLAGPPDCRPHAPPSDCERRRVSSLPFQQYYFRQVEVSPRDLGQISDIRDHALHAAAALLV